MKGKLLTVQAYNLLYNCIRERAVCVLNRQNSQSQRQNNAMLALDSIERSATFHQLYMYINVDNMHIYRHVIRYQYLTMCKVAVCSSQIT